MFLLDDILLAPLNGLIWLAKKLNDHVESKLYDPESIKASMQILEACYQREEISKKEFEAREAQFMEALNKAYEYQKQKGMRG